MIVELEHPYRKRWPPQSWEAWMLVWYLLFYHRVDLYSKSSFYTIECDGIDTDE